MQREPVKQQMRMWGPRGVTMFAFGVALAACVFLTFLLVLLLPEAGVDTNPTREDKKVTAFSPPQGDEIEVACPYGWELLAGVDEHQAVFSCTDGDPDEPQPGDWIVVLTVEGDACDVAYQVDTEGAGFVDDCLGVEALEVWTR